jgi:hypothetical protein
MPGLGQNAQFEQYSGKPATQSGLCGVPRLHAIISAGILSASNPAVLPSTPVACPADRSKAGAEITPPALGRDRPCCPYWPRIC